MQNQENSRVFYGGFFVRLAAAWVDALLVSFALITLRMPVWFMAGTGNPLYQPILFKFTPWDIFLYLLGSAYYVFLTYTTGATLGKRIFSLRVVAADGRRLSLWDVLYRETIGKYLSGAFLYLGYIMAGIDQEKRALHDMMADTRVIYSFGGKPRQPEDTGQNGFGSPPVFGGRTGTGTAPGNLPQERGTSDTGHYEAPSYGYEKNEASGEQAAEENEE